jgi:hypothetical protein
MAESGPVKSVAQAVDERRRSTAGHGAWGHPLEGPVPRRDGKGRDGYLSFTAKGSLAAGLRRWPPTRARSTVLAALNGVYQRARVGLGIRPRFRGRIRRATSSALSYVLHTPRRADTSLEERTCRFADSAGLSFS